METLQGWILVGAALFGLLFGGGGIAWWMTHVAASLGDLRGKADELLRCFTRVSAEQGKHGERLDEHGERIAWLEAGGQCGGDRRTHAQPGPGAAGGDPQALRAAAETARPAR